MKDSKKDLLILSRYSAFPTWSVNSTQCHSNPSRYWKQIQKFIWRGKRLRLVESILKKNNVRGLILPNSKTYYKATIINTVWYWWKGRQQKIRIESPEIDSLKYSQLIFDQGSKAIQCSKESLFHKWCWKTWTSMYKTN